MKFTFKIGDKIKESWPIYKAHFSTLLLLMIVTIVVQSIESNKHSWMLRLIAYIISIVLSFVWIRFILNLIDKKDISPFSKEALPSFVQSWNLIKTMILYSLCVLGGLILLIIPGIYISGRLVFAIYLSIDKNQGGMPTIKEAWKMTEGYGWLLIWKSFVIGLFMMLGIIAFFIGSFITYPIGMMVMIMMYREFSKMKSQIPVSDPTVNELSINTNK
jgi:hypothetical protein